MDESVGDEGGFALRQGRVEDAGALVDLQLRSWRVAFSHLPVGKVVDDLSPFELEQVRQHWLAQQQGPEVVWVATAGEQIVGYARTCWWQDTDDLPAATVKLHALYVDPDVMGKGVGSRLLEQAATTARQVSASGMALWTPQDLERAHRFYERHGWRADPRWTKPWRGTLEVRYLRDV